MTVDYRRLFDEVNRIVKAQQDADLRSRPQVVADLRKHLPFTAACADFIHTEDFIAVLDPAELRAFLAECRRILKPEGAMRVLTPDLARFAAIMFEGNGRLLAVDQIFVQHVEHFEKRHFGGHIVYSIVDEAAWCAGALLPPDSEREIHGYL